MKKRLLRVLGIWGIMLGLLLCYGIVTEHLGGGIPCVFQELTGLRCPGCGNTHALRALVTGHLIEALHWNYLMPAEALYVAFVIWNTSYRYVRTGTYHLTVGSEKLGIAFVAVLFSWWVLRNVFGV